MKKARGGPAKIAVIASALIGSISGSSTANVVTTGSFTIPMMKKIGLKPEFAGAVEASASTVGLILPPVMSGAAFLMAAFTGLPYKSVCLLALLPALINVYAVYLMVHFETAKDNLQVVPVDVSLAETFKRYYHILIPPLILVFLIIKGYSPGFVCSWSIIAFVAFCFLRAHTRLSVKQILDTLESGAKGALLVLVATAASGIIVGSVDLTGLGHRLASGLVELTGGNIPLTLIIAMLLTLLLGTGMPPAATYVVLVAILVPALINLGISVYAAHFFVVFFAGQSLITPPMAITSYAAATIAGADPMKTSWLAIKISLTAFIIPFMFVVNPAFLMIGSVGEIISVTITALMGVFLLAISLEGYFLQELNIFERILAFIGAILLIYPEFIFILPGSIILCILVIPQAIRSRKLFVTMDHKSEIRAAD
jgi:TRAP transporter 4TM/12TM fusion protein